MQDRISRSHFLTFFDIWTTIALFQVSETFLALQDPDQWFISCLSYFLCSSWRWGVEITQNWQPAKAQISII